jgi:glucosamine-6-phosphate deaminase
VLNQTKNEIQTTWTVDALTVRLFPDPEVMGKQVAADLAQILAETVAERDWASIILATGNSQLWFMAALRQRTDIAWNKVVVFHMDEYIGMSPDHPASFRRYMREQLVNKVQPNAFFGIEGDAPDLDAAFARYRQLLAQYQPDVCVMGIGENGHLAFNDPPADFATPEVIRIVPLDEACRRQQVGEGHFPSLDAMPDRAISLSIPTLLAARHVLVVVPESRKAVAVKAALEGPVTPNCPASILQKQGHATMYLDRESASLLA